MFITENTARQQMVLKILRSLPLEERIFIIDKPHIREIVESKIASELDNDTDNRQIVMHIVHDLRNIRNNQS